jgi:hypothetical protein
MPGDYSRFSDQPRKRFAALLMQQGRVQLDSDWNESLAILARRIEEVTADTFGRAAVPRATTPSGFQIALTGTAPALDLTIGAGRLYVDGIQAEVFAGENATYLTQPYYPNPKPLAKVVGPDVLVYVDVWQREVTFVEDPSILERALGGIDTTTRLQTVWQVKLAEATPDWPKVSCDVDFDKLFPPSGGRLTIDTVPPAEAPDPCSLPESGGYHGIENRLYRIEVHTAGTAATARFKWSRENGSVVSAVTNMAHGAATTLTVARVGRDPDLRFKLNDWVEVIDDARELRGEAGAMAQIKDIKDATNALVLDRSLSGEKLDTSGHLRVRRWDQQDGVDANGLLKPSTTPIALEDGIRAKLTVASGGALRVGDYWVFAARSTDGFVDPLTDAPPRGIVHHYASLGTVKGLGGGTTPTVNDCRTLWPPIAAEGADCECTVCVSADDHNEGKLTIQQAIEQVKKTGGNVCLGPGTFELGVAGVSLDGVNAVRLRGKGTATRLDYRGSQAAITIRGASDVAVSDLAIACTPTLEDRGVQVGIGIVDGSGLAIERCTIQTQFSTNTDLKTTGIGILHAGYLSLSRIEDNTILADYAIATIELLTYLEVELPGYPPPEKEIVTFFGVLVAGNALLALRRAVYWAGPIAYGSTAVRENLVALSVETGISVAGAATDGPLRVEGNWVLVLGSGIGVQCNDAEVSGNVIAWGMSAPEVRLSTIELAGIYAGSQYDEGHYRIAIERNRISKFVTGHGIRLSGHVARATVRDNTIDGVAGGIVLTDKADAEDLVIEGNELTDVGAAASVVTPSTLGIFTARALRVLIRDNTLRRVGTMTTAGTPILGIQVIQPLHATIAGNEIGELGSTRSLASRTSGIEVIGLFDSLLVKDNHVRVKQPPNAGGAPFRYSAIFIGDVARDQADPDRRFRFLPLAGRDEIGLLAGGTFIILFRGQGDVELTGNSVDVVPSTVSLIEVHARGACLAAQNRVSIVDRFGAFGPQPLPPGAFAAPIVSLVGFVPVVSNNHVNAFREVPGIVITTGTKTGTVLGNVVSGQIIFDGGALGDPWRPLNVVRN